MSRHVWVSEVVCINPHTRPSLSTWLMCYRIPRSLGEARRHSSRHPDDCARYVCTIPRSTGLDRLWTIYGVRAKMAAPPQIVHGARGCRHITLKVAGVGTRPCPKMLAAGADGRTCALLLYKGRSYQHVVQSKGERTEVNMGMVRVTVR
jgi:hypothetical protein